AQDRRSTMIRQVAGSRELRQRSTALRGGAKRSPSVGRNVESVQCAANPDGHGQRRTAFIIDFRDDAAVGGLGGERGSAAADLDARRSGGNVLGEMPEDVIGGSQDELFR